MRFTNVLLCLSFVLSTGLVTATPRDNNLAIRQDTSASSFPTLSTGSDSPSSTGSSPSQTQDASESPSPTSDGSASSTSGAPEGNGNSTSAASTSSEQPSTSVQDANTSTPTPPPVDSGNSTTNGTTAESKTSEPLPLQPRITPALSIAGVFLILTGIVYGLIGVKNKWIHVFLSTAYLTSLAVFVLIIYVMNPPVSNAIQGAYFVGVFMSGLIFGGGALIFKEVTEGLGCLLGGFCLSMWFLTLKSGGLITNTGGKAIFIAVFCVVCWSFSFSHYTRAYGLMFSTSFAGSTAFVLGIDCFSRGGLKEFWVYIWDLNEDIFPLNTNSYPITRGTRVETIIVVLGTIIGMISQLRLWKVVQNRQKQRAEAQAEDVRRRDAVEEALGRHLERQNDRDRSEWEKRYGDRLNAKRNTVLWSEVHGDKRLSSTSTTEVDSSQNSESKESLEMASLPNTMVKGPLHSSKNKRHSNITVQAIPEVEEEDHNAVQKQDRKLDFGFGESKAGEFSPKLSSEKFSFDQGSSSLPQSTELSKTTSKDSQSQHELPPSLRPQNTKPASSKLSARLHSETDENRSKNRSSVASLNDLKRRSLQSLRSKSPASGEKSPAAVDFSESKEALVMPAASVETHSRASSVAATLDEENEKLDMPTLDRYDSVKRDSRPPQIVISPSYGMSFEDQLKSGLPPSPSGLSDQFDVDPEELVRPPAIKTPNYMDFEMGSNSKRTSGGNTDILFEDGGKTVGGTSSAANGEGLTKGALERVPSQLSNVVLSYRTNEWAKHIATAEAPVFEEPDPITGSDQEAPTHLASPAPQNDKKLEVAEKPPPLPSPVTSVAPSEAGVKINPEIQPAEKPLATTSVEVPASISSPVTAPTTGPNVPTPSPSLQNGMPSPNPDVSSETYTQPTNPNRRSFTDPTQQAPIVPKASRRISNPMQRQPSTLQSTPIHENYATDFGVRPAGPHRTTSNAANSVQQFYSPNPSAVDLSQQQQHYPSAFRRSTSFTSHQNYSSPDIRPTSTNGSPYGAPLAAALRSETRLNDVGGKTHQPLQRNNTNESRRETLMADWRMQLAQSHNTTVVPQANVDNRYAQQMLDWEADKLRKEQDRHNRARKEAAMDQSMRTQGMIDAHREVMRKMQNKANQKITK